MKGAEELQKAYKEGFKDGDEQILNLAHEILKWWQIVRLWYPSHVEGVPKFVTMAEKIVGENHG